MSSNFGYYVFIIIAIVFGFLVFKKSDRLPYQTCFNVNSSHHFGCNLLSVLKIK